LPLVTGIQTPVTERARFDHVAQINLLWDFADSPFRTVW